MKILFKGKKLDGKWIYGYPFISNEGFFKNKTFIISNLMYSKINIEKHTFGYYEEIESNTLCEYTNIIDNEGIEIFENDLRIYDDKIFRIYKMEGGFVIKKSLWLNDISDLTKSDKSICVSLSDIEIKDWLIKNSKHYSNIFDKN